MTAIPVELDPQDPTQYLNAFTSSCILYPIYSLDQVVEHVWNLHGRMPRQIHGIDAVVNRMNYGRNAIYPCTSLETAEGFERWFERREQQYPGQAIFFKVILQRTLAGTDTPSRSYQWTERTFDEWTMDTRHARRLEYTPRTTQVSQVGPKTPGTPRKNVKGKGRADKGDGKHPYSFLILLYTTNVPFRLRC